MERQIHRWTYIHINDLWNWTTILETNTNIKTAKAYRQINGRMDGWMYTHIILPLRVFDSMACGRMCYKKLQAAQMIAKKWRRWPDRETYEQTDGRTDGHLSSTGPHLDKKDPSEGIQYYCRYYTAGTVACRHMRCAQLQAAQRLAEKRCRWPAIQIYRETYRHIISTRPHWGPSDPSMAIIALRRWTPTL